MSQETNNEAAQISPEEIKKMKEQQNKFYAENTPLLEKQVKFEELKARLEKARLEQLKFRLEHIQIEMALQGNEGESETGSDNDIDK